MRKIVVLLALVSALFTGAPARAEPLAERPPMGWNSWDAYGFTIDEAQFRANASVLSSLQRRGWTYAVIDEGWYMRDPYGRDLTARDYLLNDYGLLIPVEARFPSAANGAGLPRRLNIL